MDRLLALRLRRSLQLYQAANQNGVLAFALGIFRLDRLEDGAQAIEQLQQAGDDLTVGAQLALAQQTQQVFSGMSQLFQPFEAQNPVVPLIVCTERKISASSSVSSGRSSRSVRQRSMRSNPSWLSIRNSLVNSSIASTHPPGRNDLPRHSEHSSPLSER